ncbi:MAG: Hsp20/alpha crystallin family protein [Candidatus Aureabacteria bacterium]|nr:Hsp20/alpha crystallin family protein [Candidatus Auribacterota bacterium]
MELDKKLANKEEKKSSGPAELTYDKPQFIPATDIYEKGDSIYIVCDMPGVDEKNIDISLENDVLTLTGHQDSETHEGYEMLHRGYVSGIYQRSFTVTDGIDREKIKAKMTNGVLKIELPKAEKVKPKKIQITVEK